MILKSYLVEQNIEILKSYRATLIYGENNGIKNDIKEDIKNKNKNLEILNFFENDLLKNDLLYENIANQSLFAKKKIIFIQEATDKIFNQFEECSQKYNSDNQIYIFANNLEKKSKIRQLFEKDKNLAIFACYEDNERTLINYISKELKGFKGLTGEIINLIIDNSGMDRIIIKRELEKIKCFFIEKKISKNEVFEILNIKNNSDFNQIRDSALTGQKARTNKLLSETEISNDDAIFYLNILNYRIMRLHEIIAIIGNNKNNSEEILSTIKPPIFWKDKPIIMQQLKKWDKEKVKKTLLEIGEAEILMKKNYNLRNDIIIRNLIINLTNKASSSF
ncbi:MAG: DNA polymerase III subunit delta [Pelagibacteraceae bacterium]|nr:DNA polymerase III subunit delta [Pelagibacteraceae bacterium]